MTVNYQNIPIHFEVYGKGKPVVLLHGFLENSRIWNDFIPLFNDKLQVITIDLFGHGQTPIFSEIHHMETMAEAVSRVLDHLKIDSTMLIGHSMGGYVSMAFLEKFAGKVDRILLLNSTTLPDSENRKNERNQAIKIIDKQKEVFIKEEITRLFAKENQEVFKKEITNSIQEAMKMSNKSIKAALEGMKIRKDRTEILKDFTGEKWIITGKLDPLISPKSIQKIAEHAQAKLISLDCGHMSYIEQKKEVEQHLKNFLKI